MINNEENNKLTDDELFNVSGGGGAGRRARNGAIKMDVRRIACTSCGRPFYADINKDECKCPLCGVVNTFKG